MKRLRMNSRFGLSSSVATLFAALMFGFASCDSESGDKTGGSGDQENAGKNEPSAKPMSDDDRTTETGGATPEEEADGVAGDIDGTLKLARDQEWDSGSDGTFVNLRYDEGSGAFEGTIKNTTERLLKGVCVRVRLSNDKELGPTKPQNLLPGEQVPVKLSAKGEKFDWWTPKSERN